MVAWILLSHHVLADGVCLCLYTGCGSSWDDLTLPKYHSMFLGYHIHSFPHDHITTRYGEDAAHRAIVKETRRTHLPYGGNVLQLLEVDSFKSHFYDPPIVMEIACFR